MPELEKQLFAFYNREFSGIFRLKCKPHRLHHSLKQFKISITEGNNFLSVHLFSVSQFVNYIKVFFYVPLHQCTEILQSLM